MRALFWWIDKWRASSAFVDLDLECQGAYRNLLDEGCLRGGGIPNDPDLLARACGDARRWPAIEARVLRRFRLIDGEWRNETLDRVMAESRRRATNQANYRERKAGRVVEMPSAKGNGRG